MTDNENLDVRTLAPAERNRTIFQSWHNLRPGAAFVLVNDHDPKPLYYQFDAEHEGEFTWDYQKSGPEVWRVHVGNFDEPSAPQPVERKIFSKNPRPKANQNPSRLVCEVGEDSQEGPHLLHIVSIYRSNLQSLPSRSALKPL